MYNHIKIQTMTKTIRVPGAALQAPPSRENQYGHILHGYPETNTCGS